MAALSKTQIDKLGEGLRLKEHSNDDLTLLAEYGRSFVPAYDHVRTVIREKLQLEPTGRVPKTTPSIVAKLLRESIRLSQMQDIAGCRILVDGVYEQDRAVEQLCRAFPSHTVVDRRQDSSYGYRAVHVIVKCDGKLVEVQVRTNLQHLWAETSEKASDLIDPRIKYGAGDEAVVEVLQTSSQWIADIELWELTFQEMRSKRGFARQYKHRLRHASEDLTKLKHDVTDAMSGVLKLLSDAEENARDLPH